MEDALPDLLAELFQLTSSGTDSVFAQIDPLIESFRYSNDPLSVLLYLCFHDAGSRSFNGRPSGTFSFHREESVNGLFLLRDLDAAFHLVYNGEENGLYVSIVFNVRCGEIVHAQYKLRPSLPVVI